MNEAYQIKSGFRYGVTMAVPCGGESFRLWHQVPDSEECCPIVGGQRWYRGGFYPGPTSIPMLCDGAKPIDPAVLAEIEEKQL